MVSALLAVLLLAPVAAGAPASEPAPDAIAIALDAIAGASWGDAQPSFNIIDDAIRDGDSATHTAIEAGLCELLRDDAAFVAKQFACRRLAAIGTVQSVETLASLLDDERLSHMARFALEAIPSPEAGAVLIEALDVLHGEARLGPIHSLANRREARAADALLALVRGADVDEAEAALSALVKFGGDPAVTVAREVTESGNRYLTAAALNAFVEAAYKQAAQTDSGAAAELFGELYRNGTHERYVLAGFTGLLACPAADTRALIEEVFHGDDPMLQAAAASNLQETHAVDLVEAFGEDLESYPETAQLAIIKCAANLRANAVRPALLKAAQSSRASVRLAAIEALGSIGAAEDVALLAGLAAGEETAASTAALNSLRALEADGVDAAMLAMAEDAQPALARALISALAFRGTKDALPLAWARLASPDEALRNAANQMIEELADAGDLPALLERLGAATDEDDRRRTERILHAVCERQPKETAEPIEQALRQADETAKRIALLRVLALTENPDALDLLREGALDSDEEFRSAAIRMLADWPAPEALPDLRQIAASGDKASHRVVALRGYLNLIRKSKMPPEGKLPLVRDALPLIGRDEELPLVAAALQDIATPDAMLEAQSLLGNQAARREAAVAILHMAEKLAYSDAQAVEAALTAVQNSDVPGSVKEQANGLKQRLVDYAGRLVREWDFTGGDEGWVAENDTRVAANDGVLRVDLIGDDPFISTGMSVQGGDLSVQIRVKAPQTSQTWQIFYGSDQKALGQPPFWSVNLEAPAAPEWQELSAELHVEGDLSELRIDPGLGPDHVDIDWIRLLRSQPGVQETPALAAEPDAAPESFSSDATTRILLIGTPLDHPYGTHMYMHECGLLAKCLEQSSGVDAAVSLGWPEDEALADAADAIVLYSSPGAEIVLKGGHADQFRELMERGVGLSAIHWSTGIGDANDKELEREYLSYLGGIFSFAFSGLDMVHTDVDQLVPLHAICRGWSDYEQFDEIYLNIEILDGATPQERVDVKGKEQVVAWTYERPGANDGRSYGNTLGHFHDNFWITSFRRSLVNGILWTAHYEVPEDGAPCVVLPEDMVLPEPAAVK